MIGIPLTAILIDSFIRRKDLTVITSVYFGLLIGVFLTYVAVLALSPLIASFSNSPILPWLPLILGMLLCYVSTSVLMQTRNDFRFIIPYVEFARDVRGLRPNVLDASAIVDGRIAELADTGLFQSRFVVPGSVMEDLQQTSDEIVELARNLGGRVITNEPTLMKIAGVRGVPALNVNDIAVALRPSYVPGDMIDVKIVKQGEEPSQGVGFLDDGTMVVVEHGREMIGRSAIVSVTSTLQTSAGRLVFARPEEYDD
jgi:uncharacterized protein YacL